MMSDGWLHMRCRLGGSDPVGARAARHAALQAGRAGRCNMEESAVEVTQGLVRTVTRTGRSSYQGDRLAPLLRSLLDTGLVVAGPDGRFTLPDEVQERLQALSESRSIPEVEVFVGRPCQRCGTAAVTRLYDGTRLCGSCREALLAAADADGHEGAPTRRSGKGRLPRWLRKAG